MKKLLILLFCISFIGCNPFISKELRKKKRANRKLERLIKKYPELKTTDTISYNVVMKTKEVKIDSFIVVEKDTAKIDSLVNLIENKETRKVIKEYITSYVPFKDTVIHLINGFNISFYSSNGNIHYTIDKPSEVLKKNVRIEVPKIEKIELTPFEKVAEFVSKFFWFIVLSLLIIVVYIRFLK